MDSSNKIILCSLLNVGKQRQINAVQAVCSFNNMVMELESDSDDEMENFMSVTVLSVKDTPFRSQHFVERVVNRYTKVEFQQNFRMSIEAYEYLLHHVIQEYVKMFPCITSISIDKQLLAVIWLLANQESFRSVGDRFDMAKSTLSWVFNRIISSIEKLVPLLIKWPNAEEMVKTQEEFYKGTNLKSVIACIDGTYCSIKAPAAHAHSYTNRKCFTSITLQAICDNKMRFFDCFAGFPSSVHDARIFRNSPIYVAVERNMEKYFPDNYKILGDKAYPLLSWCIPPYKDIRRLTRQQKLFNKTHSSMRQVVERCFALYFGRFRRFRHLDMNHVEDMPKTMLVGCALHNLCLKFPEEQSVTTTFINEGSEIAERNATDYLRSNTDATISGSRIRDEMALELWSTHSRIQ